MPQKGIYDQNSKKLIRVDNNERKIFNYLLKNKGVGLTQKEISDNLNIPQPTVSRNLKTLMGKVHTYRRKEYIITREDKHYQITTPKKSSSFSIKESLTKEKEFKSDFDAEVLNLSNPNIFIRDFAELITSTVILYEINPRYRSTVTTSLMNLYNKQIHEILPCKKGIYIILKESDQTKAVRSGILRLYSEAVNQKK